MVYRGAIHVDVLLVVGYGLCGGVAPSNHLPGPFPVFPRSLSMHTLSIIGRNSVIHSGDE